MVLSKAKQANSWGNESVWFTRKHYYQNNAYKVTSRSIVVYTQIVFLSKQVLTIVAARGRNAQTIKVLGAYKLLR